MRKKTVGLYDPYLDTLGGGEKYIFEIIKVFEDKGYEINIFWDSNLQDEIKIRFNIDFKYLISFSPNIFKKKSSFFKKLLLLNKFDYFFYVTDGSYFVSTAKKNFIYCMVPQKKLYKIDLLNKIKTSNYKFISHSKFTQSWLSKWGINSQVIYPYLGQEFINTEIQQIKKEKIILVVGRFFKDLHTKRHDLAIKLFQELKKTNNLFKQYKLILVGGLNESDESYFLQLKKLANKDESIIFKTNISANELFELYRKSLIYWHLTGFGVDQEKHPEFLEHLGIAPLEAMSMGCLVFCYNAGGPKEVIENNHNGFLFNTEKELLDKTGSIINNEKLAKSVQQNAKAFIKNGFSYKVFRERVKQIL